jgi:hypothetical protein
MKDIPLKPTGGPAAPGSNKAMEAHLKKLRQERAQYIEMFSAAFLEEVGSKKASKYRLVETVEHEGTRMTTTWEFRKL